MPALRAHVVFLNAFRNAAHGAAVDALEACWPEAVCGTLAPDAWPLWGGQRFEMHLLHKDDPATWDGAIERWLAQAPIASPGRIAAPPESAFVLGYLVHLGLDTWSLYLDPALPAAVRAKSPAAWFPPELLPPNGAGAALRALAEAPIAAERLVNAEALACAEVPEGFPAAQRAAFARLAAGMAPAMAERDPWRMSRINVLRPQPDTSEARAQWEARRAAQPVASAEERAALLAAALDFTRRAIERW